MRSVHESALIFVFRSVISLNFAFVIFASGWRFFEVSDSFFMDGGRLYLLQYEPSYYATLMVPLVVFSGLSLFKSRPEKLSRELLFFFMIIIPLALTTSAGVVGALCCAFAFLLLHRMRAVRTIRGCLLTFGLIGAALLVSWLAATSTLPVFSRLVDFYNGSDSSGTVRVVQSSIVAWEIIDKTNVLFGSGLGQSKLHAIEFFNEYWPGLEYNRIANAVAATLAEFGITGVVIRLSIQIYLFFKTKVVGSKFRLVMFCFAFIYQFTGSFVTNVAEYVIWVLAFTEVFHSLEQPAFGPGSRYIVRA